MVRFVFLKNEIKTMLDDINKIPVYTMQSVWSFFKPLELMELRMVCRNFKESIDACWTPNFGVSKEVFIKIFKWTPSDEFKKCIVNGILDIDKIEEINSVLRFSSAYYSSRQKRIIELFPSRDVLNILRNHVRLVDFLTSDCSVIALKSGLISSTDIMKILASNEPYSIITLLSTNGIIALKKKLITVDQVIAISNHGQLIQLLSNNNLKELENWDLAIEKATKMSLDPLL